MEVVNELDFGCKDSHSECIDVLENNNNSDSEDGALGNFFVNWEESMTNGEDNDKNNSASTNADKLSRVELYPIETLMVDRKVMMSEGIGKDEAFGTLYGEFDGYCNLQKDYEELFSVSSKTDNKKVTLDVKDVHSEDATTTSATVATKYEFECAIKRKICAEWETTGTSVQMNVHYRNKRHSLWGHKLWNAAKYLAKRIDSGLIDVFNKRVLELGAGLGVPSLVSYLNGAKLTVITDYPDEELLEILRMNADANCTVSKLDKRALHKYAQMFAQKCSSLVVTDKDQVVEVKTKKEDSNENVIDQSKLMSKQEEKNSAKSSNGDDDKDLFTPTLYEMLNSYLQCHVCPLLWGNEEHMAHVYSLTSSHPNDSESGFDCIFLSDILFNHVCNDDLVYTVAELLSKANKNAAAYCVFSHHRPHKQLQDYQFFDKCVAHGLQWTLLDVVEHSYPLMFAEDKGPEYVRQPVKCYKLTLATDLAGLPIELSSCIKYNHDENVHLCKSCKNVTESNNNTTAITIDSTATSNAEKDNVKNTDYSDIAKTKFARNKQKNAIIDVVINGTGPVQSFLSAALARSSCNVLHCDGSAHYGGAFWTLNLKDFHNYITGNAEEDKELENLSNAKATTISGVMSCLDEHSPALCSSAMVHINHMDTLSATEQTQFQIDFLPASYMAAGDTINYIIQSNTSQYLEFQNYNLLCSLVPSQQSTPTQGHEQKNEEVVQSTCNNFTENVNQPHQTSYSWSVHDAPLSRSAVFASSLLSLLDKRRLMKFVKDIADVLVEQHHAMHCNLSDDPNYNSRATHINHTSNKSNDKHETNVNSNNESSSGSCNDSDSDNAIKAVKELPNAVVQAIQSNYTITLPAFLQSHYKLSEDAINVLTLFGTASVIECVRNDRSVCHVKTTQLNLSILHSSKGKKEEEIEEYKEKLQEEYHKATESSVNSNSVLTKHECERICDSLLAQSIRFIRQLLFSVNRFGGSTPLLLPCYGSGEVIQGMCRSSAVYGSTFVLRRSVHGIAIPSLPNIGQEERMQFAVLSNGQQIPAKVVVTPMESASQIAITLEEWKYILRAGKRLMRTRNTIRSTTKNSIYNENVNDEVKELEEEEEYKTEEMIKLPLTLQTVLNQCNGTYNCQTVNSDKEKEHFKNAIHSNMTFTGVNKDSKKITEQNENVNDSSEITTTSSSSSFFALTRLVVVTKTPLFHETNLQSYLSANDNEEIMNNSSSSNSSVNNADKNECNMEGNNEIDRAAPLVMALVKIPEKVKSSVSPSDTNEKKSCDYGNGVIYLVQHTKTSEQAPASITERQASKTRTSITNKTAQKEQEHSQYETALATHHNNTESSNTTHHNPENTNVKAEVSKTYFGPSILHFMVDAQYMTQEELYNLVMNELLPSLYLRNKKRINTEQSISDETSKNNGDNNDFSSWIIYCASFTISAESIARGMQVCNPYSPPSETLKTDDYSILDNLKVERAIQHQRDRLLRTHDTQLSTPVKRTSEHDKEETDNLINEALEQINENLCVFTAPSLLPNVLDDGAYMRRAKEIYERIMHVLHTYHPFLAPQANTENSN